MNWVFIVITEFVVMSINNSLHKVCEQSGSMPVLEEALTSQFYCTMQMVKHQPELSHKNHCDEQNFELTQIDKKTMNTENISEMSTLCFDQSHAGPCGCGGRMGFSVTELSWFLICFGGPQDVTFILSCRN